MPNKKITILTEGGQQLGFGHITRCISICQHFDKFGVESEFIVEGDDSVLSMLQDYPSTLMDWIGNKLVLSKLQNSAFILIDSLRVTSDQIKAIQEISANIIYIDDEKRQNILDKGFVLDWTVLSDKRKHFLPRKKNVTYLLGSRYTPLRRAFTSLKKVVIKQKLENILISFGGSDVRNLTPLVLKNLNEKYPDYKKTVVVGAGFENVESIESCQSENVTLAYDVDANKMASLMQKSDIAISSGGQTLYELACLGVPTIAILLVDNARDDTEGWAKVGAVEYIGDFDDMDLMTRLTASIEKLGSYEARYDLQHNGAKFIDSSGGDLIVSTILNKAK